MIEIERHQHHIVPHHMGGDDLPDNLTPPISIALHAVLHKDLYGHFGKTQDYIAWKMLEGQSLKGIIFTPEVRKKMSISQTGKIKSKETKEKHRVRMLGNQHTKGKKIRTTEEIEKFKLVNIGRKASEETRKILRQAHLGICPTDETKRRMSISQKARWERKRKKDDA